MRLTRISILCCLVLFQLISGAQTDDCKKLTSKKSGASGNDCCKNEAQKADLQLLHAQIDLKDSLGKLHAPFGLPKSKNKNIFILYAPGYICGYDTALHIPVWVQYRMWNSKQWDKSLKRTNCFRPDPRLSKDLQISHADYTNSGFDRGHIKPANDAKLNKVEHLNSFLMTNMAPQYGAMNRQEWKAIEAYANGLSKQDSIKRAYMITGSIVSENPKMIKNKVAIPSWFYKIFFFQNTSLKWYYWVFYVKNDKVKVEIRVFEKELAENIKSIDQLEQLTNTNFFVSKGKQRSIERKIDSRHLKSGMFKYGYSSKYSTDF